MNNKILSLLLIPAFVLLYFGTNNNIKIFCIIGIILVALITIGIFFVKKKK